MRKLTAVTLTELLTKCHHHAEYHGLIVFKDKSELNEFIKETRASRHTRRLEGVMDIAQYFNFDGNNTGHIKFVNGNCIDLIVLDVAGIRALGVLDELLYSESISSDRRAMDILRRVRVRTHMIPMADFSPVFPDFNYVYQSVRYLYNDRKDAIVTINTTDSGENDVELDEFLNGFKITPVTRCAATQKRI